MSTLSTANLAPWKDRMIHLSGLDNTTNKDQFITSCQGLLRGDKKLSPEEVAQAWNKLKKTLPKDHYTQTIFKVINVAGVFFLLVIGARACL